MQYDMSYNSSVELEFKDGDTTRGDPVLHFDPDAFVPLRDSIESRTTRLGGHYRFDSGSNLVASFIYVDSEEQVTFQDIPINHLTFYTSIAELQHQYNGDVVRILSGSGAYTERRNVTPLGIDTVSTRPRSTSFYSYAYLRPFGNTASFTLGVSADYLDLATIPLPSMSEINPKLGLVWNMTNSTTLRVGAFRALKRGFFTSLSLEPTQVAGFNQLFDDFEGARSLGRGIAVDQRISTSWFIGAEATRRDLKVLGSVGENFDWRERSGRAYVYWIAVRPVTLSASYDFERLQRPPELTGFEIFTDVTTQKIPVAAFFNFASGLQVKLRTTHVAQYGTFAQASTASFQYGAAHFWVTDAAVSYRLPNRAGLFSLELRNLFNQHFNFQETDLGSISFARDRTILGRLMLYF
jgi:hypothetical protein